MGRPSKASEVTTRTQPATSVTFVLAHEPSPFPLSLQQRVVTSADPEVLPRNLLKTLMSHTMFGGELQVDPGMEDDVLEDAVRSTRALGKLERKELSSYSIPVHLANRKFKEMEENQARRA